MIQAIETHYNGYRFRSRLEARWAVFFDALGIQWEYETEGYKYSDVFYQKVTYRDPAKDDYFIGRGFLRGGYYLPDFWLPHHDTFIEIKGESLNDEDESKAIGLATEKQKYVAVCIGNIGVDVKIKEYPPHFQSNEHPYFRPNRFLECLCCHEIVITTEHPSSASANCHPCECYGVIMPSIAYNWDDVKEHPEARNRYRTTPRIISAYQSARSARFEHGETPRASRKYR